MQHVKRIIQASNIIPMLQSHYIDVTHWCRFPDRWSQQPRTSLVAQREVKKRWNFIHIPVVIMAQGWSLCFLHECTTTCLASTEECWPQGAPPPPRRRLETKIKQTWSTASWLCEPLQRAGKQLMGMIAQIDQERFLDDHMRAELGAIPRLQRRLP